MKNDFIEEVYLTLTGNLLEEYCVPGVENAFAEGSECEENYGRMLEAYERLCIRLGVKDDDQDVEDMINALLDNQYNLGRKMFQYGARFGEKKPQP